VRIIHILDAAGIGSILCKYLRLAGHDAKLIGNTSLNDKYGIYDYYKDYIVKYPSQDFNARIIKEAADADVIHIHSNIGVLAKIRKTYGPRKKIVLHYHGTDLRGLRILALPHRSLPSDLIIYAKFLYKKTFHKSMHSRAQQTADSVLVSTRDLLPRARDAIHLPTPIDTEHFTLRTSKGNDVAFMIDNEMINSNFALDYCKRGGIRIPIKIYDRTLNPVLYECMPEFLKKHSIYVDIRFVNGELLDSLSSTGLQSLACGLTVLNYDLKYITSLPPEHRAEKVTSKLLSIYDRL
jgi:hypothetical protein